MKNKRLLIIVLALSLIVSCILFSSCGDKNSITYSFSVNGGQEISDEKVEKGTEYTLPIPTREGYSFEGWYDNEELKGQSVTTVTGEENKTFFAKWEKQYKISLALDGGTLSVSSIMLKSGENIYDSLKDYKPTKQGVVFGAWFIGENELSKSARMGEEDITLTAKYKAEYRIEIWEQNVDLNGYTKLSEDVKLSDYIGNTVNSDYSIKGFKEVRTENTVSSIVVSGNTADNVLKIYFDRESYRVVFDSNYPTEVENETRAENVVSGKDINVPADLYKAEGYILVGWSTSSSGKAEYKANYINTIIYNTDADAEVESDKFTPERNTTLYAVWTKGYIDMFGGNDYIYLLDDASDDIYLSRGEIFFKGIYDNEEKTFTFEDKDGNILIEGKLNDNNTFTYYDPNRANESSALYEMGKGINDKIKIYLDTYNGLTYSVEDENGRTTQSHGTYSIDDNGFLVTTFTDGELNGKTLTLILGQVNVNNVLTPAFQIVNDDEIALGTLVRFGVNNNRLSYYQNVYTIRLTGYGIAVFYDGQNNTAYYYYFDENDNLILMNNSGQNVGIARIMDELGKKGYMFYNESLDLTITAKDNSTLTTDGLCNATYTNGDKTAKGYYTVKSSVFGGYIITFVDSNETYTFLITSAQKEVIKETTGENGEESSQTEIVTEYNFERKQNGYAEYYYKDADGYYYAPLLVVNDSTDNLVYLYGYTSDKKYEKVAAGTFTFNKSTGLYTFVITERFENNALTSPVDMSAVLSFDCALDTTSTSYSINYWYSVTTEEGTVDYENKYTSESGATLSLVAGMATYSADGYVLTGAYSVKDGYTIISNSNGTVYLIVDEENKTFVALKHAPYYASNLGENGQINKNEYIYFTGTDEVVYVEIENNVETEFKGTVIETDKTTYAGGIIYKFVSDERTFEYIQLSYGSNVIYAKYNEQYNGNYESDDGILKLDGFCFNGEYLDSDGNVKDGMYYVLSENQIVLVSNTDRRTYVFDVNCDDKTFTVRGQEYGTYILLINQSTNGLILRLDGYGNLSVFETVRNEEDEAVLNEIDVNGKYEKDGDIINIEFKKENELKKYKGKLDTITVSGNTYYTFTVLQEEVVSSYVNEEDWSVLYLDSIGNAVKYDKDGNREEGTFTVFADDLLYYVTDDSSFACIYRFSKENGTATPTTFKSRGYYTKDLDSLLFTKYGFAIFNAETRYYYNIENENVYIYLNDPENKDANKYGYVKENFGKFTNIKEYNGDTYYENTGYAITFKRLEEGKDKYPVKYSEDLMCPIEDLVFSPTGNIEFSVSGTVRINSQNYNCTVTRVKGDDDQLLMYVTVGYYRFDITISYLGENEDGTSKSTYEVTGLKRIYTAPSYTYMDTYYMIYSFFGANVANSFPNEMGNVSINFVYDEEGTEVDHYIEGEFGKSSGLADSEGNIVQLPRTTFEILSNGLYKVSVNGEDGFTYNLYITLTVHQAFGQYGYKVYAFTREQTLTANDGYSVNVERIVSSDVGKSWAGSLYSATLYKNEEKVESTSVLISDNVLYYIVRDIDDNNAILSTIIYKIDLTEKETGPVEEGETAPVAIYESAAVTAVSTNNLYTPDNKSYIDINGSNEVMVVTIGNSKYIAQSSSYDEDTKTYTVTINSTTVYEIKVTEDNQIEISLKNLQAEE